MESNKTEDVGKTNPTKTYRDNLIEKYPDIKIENDDYNPLFEKYYNDSQTQLDNYKNNEQAVADIINSDPDFEAILTEMIVNKTPLRVAITKFLSEDELISKAGDEDYQAWQSARDERLNKAKKRKSDEEVIAQNEKKSIELIDSFLNEKGLKDEKDKDNFIQIVNDVFENLLWKKITPEFLELCFKGSTYDKAVKKATEDGQIAGLNKNIEAKMASNDATGDGIPTPQGGIGSSPEQRRRRDPFLGDIKERKSI